MQKVGVRFNINPKIYTFVSDLPLSKGDFVIVETAVGQGFGIVENLDGEIIKNDSKYKVVVRKATEKDIKQNEENKEREKLAIAEAKALSEKYNLEMNVVNAEFSFDGSKVVIDFISENRVDFRDLVKELANKLKTRIELRQIGIRDQAKMVGGIGICGRVCCCAAHLKDFEKVSIKMAKVQGLALNPTKISGSCGRLMCCLEYENDYYSEVYPKIPKLNSIVSTPEGKGTVMYTNALKQIASIRIESKDGSVVVKDFSFDQIKKDGDGLAGNLNDKNQKEIKDGPLQGRNNDMAQKRDVKDVKTEDNLQKDNQNKNKKKNKKHFKNKKSKLDSQGQ